MPCIIIVEETDELAPRISQADISARCNPEVLRTAKVVDPTIIDGPDNRGGRILRGVIHDYQLKIHEALRQDTGNGALN